MAKKISGKKKKTIIISSILVVVVAAGVLYAVFKPEDKLSVETVTATKDTINATLDTTGTVSSASEGDFALVDGAKVASVNVKVGDIVEAGDVIATFDTSSLSEALNQKEETYEKAQSAYNSAVTASENAKNKVDSVKKQVSDLEAQVSKLEAESKTAASTTTTTKKASSNSSSSVKVSDAFVSRFVNIAKLLGVEYSNDEARKILTNMLSAGSSLADISSLMDNLSTIANSSGSFDMSALSGMSTSSSSLMSAEMSLVQLKAQLATLEVQSDSTYVSTFKTIADKSRSSYEDAQTQINKMKNGWTAESKGIVSEVNVTVGQTKVNSSSSSESVDISSILSAVTSGSDVSSMINSFFNSDKTAVKILYYPLVADVALSKYDVLNVKLNQDVSVKSANGTIFDGKVSYVSAVAKSSDSSINLGSLVGSGNSSSTIPAQVTIENADNSVIVGTDVDISIVTDTAENTVIVPVEAVCIENSDIFVYKYDEKDSKAVKQKVTLGISNDTYYQVTSGVNEGDVLLKNTSGLKDGIKVSVK